jgi:hypothetical protein
VYFQTARPRNIPNLISNGCFNTNSFRKNTKQGPSIRKKNGDFILVRTTTKSIQFIKKKTSVFVFIFHVVVLVLLAKQQQQKIVNLNMISVCYAWALIPSYR